MDVPAGGCESAWNKDPVFGVIGIQSGPPGRRVHSNFRGGYGGQVGDAGSGDADSASRCYGTAGSSASSAAPISSERLADGKR
jgi:hypothetical protein